MKTENREPPWLWVAGVLLFAVLVHLPGLHYGLPFHLANDELPLIGGALRMIQLHNPIPSMNPGPMAILYYPPGLPWLYLVIWAPVLAAQWVLAGFPTASAFSDIVLTHLGPLWMVSRLISVAFLAGTIWVVIRLTSEMTRDRLAAVIAGALVATSFHHAILAQFARVWEPTVFFFWCGLWACWRIYKTGERSAYVWAAFAAGFGFAVNYVGVLVSLGVAAAHLLRHRRIVIDRSILLHAAIVALFLAVILAVSWPNFVRLFGVTTVASGRVSESGSLILFYLWTLLKSDPLLVLIGVLGLPLLVYRAWALIVFFLVVFIPYSMVILSGTGFDDRYILPLTPILAIAGGAFATFPASKLRMATLTAAGVIVVAQGVLLLQLAHLMTRRDTREIARAWASTHVPAGEGVLVALRGMTFEQTLRSIEFERELAPNGLDFLQRKRLSGADIKSGGGGPQINAIDIRQVGLDALKGTSPRALLDRLESHNYHWLLIDNLAGPIGDGSFERLLLSRAKLVGTIAPDHGVVGPNFNLTDQFAQAGAWNILWLNRLGPPVRIYHFE